MSDAPAVRRRHPSPQSVVVGLVVAFNAWMLWAEALPAHALNDASMHQAYLQWAADRLTAGHLPLDGLFTQLGLGFPIFHHYQVLPHLLLAPVAAVAGAAATVSVSTYLLLVTWPISVYAGARLLGLARWPAAGAAAVAPLLVSVPGYGLELGSYLWRGYGMWTQLWGMWLFPLALGLTWRAVARRRSMAVAALVTGITLAVHLLTGYLVLVALGVWVVVGTGPVLRRAGRALLVALGAMATSAWLLLPALIDQPWARMGLPQGTFWLDSYGAGQVLSWFGRGQLFDAGHLPVVTVFVVVGVLVALRRWRRDPAARAALGFFAVSLLLYFGRPTLGPLADLLPGQEGLFLHRMIIGVHLGGIWLAGLGLAATGAAMAGVPRRLASRRASRVEGSPASWVAPLASVTAVVALAVVLSPAWRQTEAFAADGATWIGEQRAADAGSDAADFAALVDQARVRGDGRLYAGLLTNWGAQYRVGYVPAVIELLHLGADAVGFTGRVPALTEPTEARFDDADLDHYELLGVRYAVGPSTWAGPPGGVLLAASGRHRLWQVPTSGYLRLVDTTSPLTTSRQQIDVTVGEQLRSSLPTEGRYPLLALDGRGAGVPSVPPGALVAGSPGSIEQSAVDVAGRTTATVLADRPAALLVKVSAHGRWRAAVDGRPVSPQTVAPGLVVVPVPAGRHEVTAWYEPIGSATYVGLFALGLVALTGLAGLDARTRRRAVRAAGSGPGGPVPDAVAGAGQPLVVDELREARVVAGAVVEGSAVVDGATVVGATVVAGTGTREASVGSSRTASCTS